MSVTKGMHYTTAKKCPHHNKVCEEAVQQLARKGVFKKDTVLRHAGYSTMSDSIRWDYIVRMIEEHHNTSLIPLASAYWPKGKRGDKSREDYDAHPPPDFPNRYIAGGHGGKTAGYAIASQMNGHFVITVLQRMESQLRNSANTFNARRGIAARVRVPMLGPQLSVVGVMPTHKPRVMIETDDEIVMEAVQ